MALNQGQNSLLFPPHLLPAGLKEVPKICLTIGKFLKVAPDAPAPDGQAADQVPKRCGRPRKGQELKVTKQTGSFGGQQCRRVEEQIRILQHDSDVDCIPTAPFLRLVKESLSNLSKEPVDYLGPVDEIEPPQLRISSAALKVLKEAVEAGAQKFF